MAMTSQASNSVTTTGTLSSSSPTPSNGSSETIADLFSSGGSPPLVVAFLAIGLFVTAMLFVFARRRLLESRGLSNRPVVPIRRHKSAPLGEKPVLWDVWADPKFPRGSFIETTRWGNITKPMTANLTFLIPNVQSRPAVDPPSRIGPLGPNGFTAFRMLRSMLSAVKRFYFPRHPPPPPPPPPGQKEAVPASPTSDEIEWGDASSLQVSVIITMPTGSGDDTDPEGIELGEYCIGTMDVSWSEGG